MVSCLANCMLARKSVRKADYGLFTVYGLQFTVGNYLVLHT
jgi:hypothetical protein